MSSTVTSDLEHEPADAYQNDLQVLDTFVTDGNENDQGIAEADLVLEGLCENVPFSNTNTEQRHPSTQPIDFVDVSTEDQLSDFEIEDESESDEDNVRLEDVLECKFPVKIVYTGGRKLKKPVKFDDLDIKLLSKFPDKNVVFLTCEEEDVIKNCKDPKLKQLLVLNRLRQIHLEKFYKGCFRAYHQCCNSMRCEWYRLQEQVQQCRHFSMPNRRCI